MRLLDNELDRARLAAPRPMNQGSSYVTTRSVLDLLIRQAEGATASTNEIVQTLLSDGCDWDSPQLTKRHHRVRIRDEALRRAAEGLRWECASTWELASRLERAIRRFETRVLPRLWGSAEVELGPVDFFLRRAFLSGAGIPKSQRSLYELLK
jgi:hypothetical protein